MKEEERQKELQRRRDLASSRPLCDCHPLMSLKEVIMTSGDPYGDSRWVTELGKLPEEFCRG